MQTRSLRLQLALGALAALQVVHLLDSLRTDDDASFPRVLLTPQAVLGIGGAVTALVLERHGYRLARRLAAVVAGLVGLGFVVVHGVPFASDRTEPYWGDGSADAAQWLGVLAVLAAAGATLALVRSSGVTAVSRSVARR